MDKTKMKLKCLKLAVNLISSKKTKEKNVYNDEDYITKVLPERAEKIAQTFYDFLERPF